MVKRKSEAPTIESIFNEFLLEKRARGVTEKYIKDLTFCVDMFLDDVNLSKTDSIHVITKAKVIEWTNFLRKKDLSVESVNNYLRNLRTFVNWCINNQYLVYFKVQMVKGQEERLKFYTEEELAILTERPPKNCNYAEERTWVIICLILATGLRASSVCNIKKEDILGDKLLIREQKNKKICYIPLTPSIVNILNNYSKSWDIDNEYLFTSMNNNILTVSALRLAITRYCIKRNIQPRGVHALRHSFAREWIKNGGNALQLQYMLQHSSMNMTQKYVKLFGEDIDIEYTALDKYLKDNKRVKRV